MKQIAEFLEKNNTGTLITMAEDMPTGRPFKFQFIKDNKFYFVSSATNDVVKQLKVNSKISFVATGDNEKWLQISGNAEFVEDSNLKKEALEQSDELKNQFKDASDQNYILFCICKGCVALNTYVGEVIEGEDF